LREVSQRFVGGVDGLVFEVGVEGAIIAGPFCGVWEKR